MHECPTCGQTCDCDIEDTWLDPPDDCSHECEDFEDDLTPDLEEDDE